MANAVLICCTMRTGSTLLQHLLTTAKVCVPLEYLNGHQPPYESIPALARQIVHAQRDYPLVGARLFWDQLNETISRMGLSMLPAETLDLLAQRLEEETGGEVKYVWLTREDTLRQAVSVLRAEVSGRWSQTNIERRQDVALPFNRQTVERVATCAQAFDAANDQWEQWFAERGIDPLKFSYEVFTHSPRYMWETVNAILRYTGLIDMGDTRRDLFDLDIPLIKQAGDDVEKWIDKYQKGVRP